MGTVLRNVRSVLDPERNISIRFTEDRIAEIGSPAEYGEPERYVFPGFVNAHTHLPMVLFRGLAEDVPLKTWLEESIWPVEMKLSPEDVYWCALLACANAIRSGTTCVVDMYFHVDEIARAIDESGLRALLSYGMIAERLDEKGKSELAKTRQLVERLAGTADGRIRVAVAPHTLYTVSEDVWREAIAMAVDLDLPMHTHVSETRCEVDAWRERTGESPVQTLERLGALERPMLAAHCVHTDEADLEILGAHDIVVGHCPKSNAKLGSGIAPIRSMLDKGICVGLGTDGAGSNNRLDMFEELRAAWIAQCATNEDPGALSRHEVLEMAIRAPRKWLGFPSGRFDVGEQADIVVVDPSLSDIWPPHDPASTLAYAATAASVTDVYVAGRPLMKDGELLTIDEERVQSEVERVLKRHVETK